MTDRPTIFADPIVRVLLDGGKPQAYRLALSPRARVFPPLVRPSISARLIGMADEEPFWQRALRDLVSAENYSKEGLADGGLPAWFSDHSTSEVAELLRAVPDQALVLAYRDRTVTSGKPETAALLTEIRRRGLDA